MNRFSTEIPRIGISACLLGHKVRYDGADKRDGFLAGTVGRYVDWVPVCPELEAGMGVPREPVRLVGAVSMPRMVAERSGRDWTQTMRRWGAKRARGFAALGLSGYIFKKDSPSCGMERVRVYGSSGMPVRRGRGLFSAAVMQELPLLPVEEEGRLNDPALRENFIERVFAYHRWQRCADDRRTVRSLMAFHAAHKFLLLAHGEQRYRRLGRIVAEAHKSPIGEAYETYGRLFMEALAVQATVKKHYNVLQHMIGFFSQQLSADDRAELVEQLADYRRQWVPLIVPLTLVRHYVKKYRVAYLAEQVYLEPSPKELMLRNHV
jgi:uncharacterized protein YbgA (DUF1722 family)/uncharacterized protein YbbK (DUF523 family)